MSDHKKKKKHRTGYNFPNTCYVRIDGGPIRRMTKVEANSLPTDKVQFISRSEAKKSRKV